jgi:iron complex outermembrane receptor protein
MNFVSTPVRSAVLGLLAPVSLCVSMSAVAQTATLKEVVVSASRFEEYRENAPMALQVLTREEIMNSGVNSVPDALRMLAGVNVRSNAAGQFDLNSAIDLGGFGVTASQNTLVLVDGRRLNPIDSSEIAWGGVNLSSIERIEIANGGAGVQYGAGATGGVINIITKPSNKDVNAAQVSAGSFGTAQANLQMDRQLGDVSLGFNASAVKSDGWRENSQVQAQNMLGRVKKVLDAHSYVFAELGTSQQINGFPGGVLNKVGEGDQRAVKFNNVGSSNSVTQQVFRLGGFKAVSDVSSLDVDLSLTKKSSDFKQPYYDTADSFGTFGGVDFVTGPGRSTLDADVVTFSPKFKTIWASGGSVVAGYDFSKATQSGAALFGPAAQQLILNNQVPFGYTGGIVTDLQAVQLLNQSLYALGRLPVNQTTELSAGWRRQTQNFDSSDINKSSGSQTTQGQYSANAYEAAINIKAGPNSRYFARLNQAFRFANTDEYWGFDPNTGARVFSGELKPQNTRAIELGYEQSSGHHAWMLLAGQSITQDEIRYSPNFFRNSNLTDDVFRTSAVGSYSYVTTGGGRLMLGARFQRAEFKNGDFAGQALGLVPNAIYTASWVQALDARTKAGLSVMHVSKQNYDIAPESADGKDQMPAYTTADVFWSRTYGQLDTKVTIKNVTGSVYSNYGGYGSVQGPAATLNSSYYYFPSDPRSLHLSVSYRF